MSNESLTNEEVASLLNPHGNAQPPEIVEAQHAQREQPDAQRSAADLQLHESLRTMHASFAERFASILEARTRTSVNMRISDMKSISFNEFSVSLDNPTCLSVVKAKPFDDQFLIDISPSILFPIIDRLLGGRVESSAVPQRPLTEIEQRLASRIVTWLLDELAQSWQSVAELEFSLDRLEHNPRKLQILARDESIVVVRLEVNMLSAFGIFSIAIPQRCLNSVADKLIHKSDESFLATNRQSDENIAEVVATLTESTISAADLAGLRVGDIITTEKNAGEPIQVSVDGTPEYEAAIGTTEGRKAVRIKNRIAHESGDD